MKQLRAGAEAEAAKRQPKNFRASTSSHPELTARRKGTMRKIRKSDYFELVVFLMHYHSGQWSRGYRLLSKLLGGGHITSACERECGQTEIYAYLVAHYAHKV